MEKDEGRGWGGRGRALGQGGYIRRANAVSLRPASVSSVV